MSSPGFRRFSVGLLAYNLVVVLFGAYVRVTGSGAGCGSHWPSCNGVAIPVAPRLETVIEYAHRMTSGVDALLVLGLVVWALLAHARGAPVRRAAVTSGVLTVTEALLGAALVIFHLVEKDASAARAVAISLHLVNTFALLAALTATVRAAYGGTGMRLSRQGLAVVLWGGSMVLVTVLAITGAITALGDTLFPSATFVAGFQQDFHPGASFLLRLRVVHPLLACVTVLVVCLSAWRLVELRPGGGARRAAWAVTVISLSQVALGLVNLALAAPAAMQLLHLLVADLTWIALMLLGTEVLAKPKLSESLQVAA